MPAPRYPASTPASPHRFGHRGAGGEGPALRSGVQPESLVPVRGGGRDILVGISGFGSASVPPARWLELATLTGRTSFALTYDAQEMQFPDPNDPGVIASLPSLVGPFFVSWKQARRAARSAAEYLATWLERWISQERRVLVVGFSLGGYIAMRGTRMFRHPNVELILISAAAGDRPEILRGIERQGRTVNLYSRSDFVLGTMYPYGVGADETPAAGLGPLRTSAPNVASLDMTHLIGRDHLWASEHCEDLARDGLRHLLDGAPVLAGGPRFGSNAGSPLLTAAADPRLVVADPAP